MEIVEKPRIGVVGGYANASAEKYLLNMRST